MKSKRNVKSLYKSRHHLTDPVEFGTNSMLIGLFTFSCSLNNLHTSRKSPRLLEKFPKMSKHQMIMN